MFARGKIFATVEQFVDHYRQRVKARKEKVFEDIRTKGISLKNLNDILYVPETEEWLSTHLLRTFERSIIREIVDYDDPVDEWLGGPDYERAILQFVDMPVDPDPSSPEGQKESHAAVLAWHENCWYLLDTAMDEPLNLTENNDAALDWIMGIEYINLFVLKPRKCPAATHERLLLGWERALGFAEAGKRGGFRRLFSGKRNKVRKSARTSDEVV